MNTTKEVEFDYETYTRDNAPDSSKIQRGPDVHKRRRKAFKSRLINHTNMQIKHAREMRHVFISYCHENKAIVKELSDALTSNDVVVWVDWENLVPGTPWKRAIQKAIQHGDFFMACFSSEYNDRDRSYMNEELSIAIDNLREKPVDRIWFIPVKVNECEIPDINIREGETLQDLQYVDLNKDWNSGIQQILNFMSSKSSEPIKHKYKEDDNCVMFRSVNGQHYFIPFQEVYWDSKGILLTLNPTSSEQTSFLCSMRKGRHDVLAFAHQEEAMWVKPQEVAESSNQGRIIWEVILKEDTAGQAFKYRTEKVNFEHLSIDQIAYMRAKRLLLDEKLEAASPSLKQANIFDQMLLEVQIRGELSSQYGNRIQALKSPIPELYNHFKTSPETFIKLARITLILYLKLSNTIEDIIQLDLKLVTPTELQVKFKGRRSQQFVNQEPVLLEVQGICPLPE